MRFTVSIFAMIIIIIIWRRRRRRRQRTRPRHSRIILFIIAATGERQNGGRRFVVLGRFSGYRTGAGPRRVAPRRDAVTSTRNSWSSRGSRPNKFYR